MWVVSLGIGCSSRAAAFLASRAKVFSEFLGRCLRWGSTDDCAACLVRLVPGPARSFGRSVASSLLGLG
eukprot:4235420-Lingulodinium_polyedra.AAC.1